MARINIKSQMHQLPLLFFGGPARPLTFFAFARLVLLHLNECTAHGLPVSLILQAHSQNVNQDVSQGPRHAHLDAALEGPAGLLLACLYGQSFEPSQDGILDNLNNRVGIRRLAHHVKQPCTLLHACRMFILPPKTTQLINGAELFFIRHTHTRMHARTYHEAVKILRLALFKSKNGLEINRADGQLDRAWRRGRSRCCCRACCRCLAVLLFKHRVTQGLKT